MKKFTKSLLTLVLLVLAVGWTNSVKAQTDYWMVCDGAAQTNSWDKQAGYTLPAPLEAGGKYVLKADIKSAKGGKCSVWATWEASDNKNQWGGTNDVQYLAEKEITTTLETYTWEFTSTWADDKISFVFGKLDGNIYFDNISLKKEGSDVELIANGDFSEELTGWSAAGSTHITREVIPSDPLAPEKAALGKAIALGQKQNPFAKTAASFKVLTDAVTAGEAELENASATSESLTAASKAITDAIAGFKLEEGYVNLTKSMFHEWTGIGDDATIKGAGGCDLVIGSSIGNGGMLYGNASVKWDQYAKLINAKALILLGTPNGITFGARTDRLEVGNGGGDGNGGGLTTLDLKIADGIASVDLSDKASVRINAIKNGWGGPATVTDLLVEFKPRAVTVGAAGYATFSSELNTKVSGTKAYAAKVNGNKVVLTEVTEIPAGSGVIVETEGNYQFPVLNEAEAIAENDLKVSDGTVTGDGSTIYVLAKGGSGIGFYPLKSGNTLEAGKAYLQIGGSARGFIGFEGATGINEVNVNKAAAKTGKIYNLNGQIVSKPSKGLFIVDGKVVSF